MERDNDSNSEEFRPYQKEFWERHEELHRQVSGLSNDIRVNNPDSPIPFMGGRPQRDLTITSGEIMDLIISLEADTLEQFNARYGMSIA